MAKAVVVAMTPVAAVVRHVEWLEFALAAARDEETRRRERLGRATDKNREKRTIRLAEVTAEVRELGALVQGLKDLQARSVAASRSTGTRLRSVVSTRKSTATATASTATRPAAAAAIAPKATTAAKPKTSAAKPRATAAAKPSAGAAKPKTRRGTKPKTSSAKAASTRSTKPATRRRGSGPSSAS